MGRFIKRASAVTAMGAMVVGLAACGDSGSSDSADGGPRKGGTIKLLDIPGNYEGTDPASIYYGHQIASFRRLVYRSLVALPADKDPDVSGKPVPDLATDTGTTPDSGKTWTFTLKGGAKWEDGKEITCEDFAYGLSRSFDETLVNGTGPGTTYVSDLDIPKNADGAPDYTGPFTSTPEQQANYDKAVSCDGKTITYKFSKAFPDFPQSVASLLVTDPYRKDLDQGAKNLFKVFSNGPYKIEGNTFDNQKGASFVRNENYDPATDDKKLREANPDVFDFELLQTPESIIERLINNNSKDVSALYTGAIPSSFYSRLGGAVAERTMKTASPYTRFLQINNKRVTDPKVRLALITALDREAGLKVLGGDNYGKATSTIVSESTPGFKENPALESIPAKGDAAAAKALLTEAGKDGLAIKVSYAQTDTNDKVFAVFKRNWEEAGFKVTLNGISPDAQPGYYAQMSEENKDTDVFYAGWASDWPSLLSVIPSVLETNNPGFNYGYYSNPAVDDFIAKGREAIAGGDTDGMVKNLQDADEAAGKDAAYIPFLQQKNYYIFGSKVGGFLPDVATSYYPDFGVIYVKK